MNQDTAEKRIRNLPIWQGEISIKPLGGGRTNLNFVVSDDIKQHVVRFGGDLPEHQLMRFNEVAASRAAHLAGLSPEVIHTEPGMSVVDFIVGKTLDEPDVANDKMLERIVPLVRQCHTETPKFIRGPVLMFWVFHVIRDYAATLLEKQSDYAVRVPDFLKICEKLESDVGPTEIVFGHNDLVAANFLDDGTHLWLIDWDYAGFNSPLFDLGGLASNNSLSEAQEKLMLELYYNAPVNDALMHRYQAMKCASLLRETMWSMVSELTSSLDVDYAAYTIENLARFEQAYDTFLQS